MITTWLKVVLLSLCCALLLPTALLDSAQAQEEVLEELQGYRQEIHQLATAEPSKRAQPSLVREARIALNAAQQAYDRGDITRFKRKRELLRATVELATRQVAYRMAQRQYEQKEQEITTKKKRAEQVRAELLLALQEQATRRKEHE